MKIITVKNCGECPYIRPTHDGKRCFCMADSKIFMKKSELSIIYKNCPLADDAYMEKCEWLYTLIKEAIHVDVYVQDRACEIMKGKV